MPDEEIVMYWYKNHIIVLQQCVNTFPTYIMVYLKLC